MSQTARKSDDNIRTHSQESTLDANMIKILLCLIFSKAFRLPRQGHVAVLGGGVGVASIRADEYRLASRAAMLTLGYGNPYGIITITSQFMIRHNTLKLSIRIA